MKIRSMYISWILCFIAYLLPWARSSTGILLGFNLTPFTTPYIAGLVIGFPQLVTKAKKILPILACILMVWGVFNVVFYWYNLALHYIAIGGGVAEILIGTWIALATAFLHLVVTIYRYQSR
jgi:hypothetical protein